jgi:hypothetical protein
VAEDRKRLPRTPGIAVPFSSIDMPGKRWGSGWKDSLNCNFQQGHLGTTVMTVDCSQDLAVVVVLVTAEERWLWWWRGWWW